MQGILAAILGIGVVLKLGWYRIKALFGMTDQSVDDENGMPGNEDELSIE